jgi:putative aldouronate transport system substrate-binding protein
MNKKAKNPVAFIAFLDWMLTDGWWPLTFGEEGRHYRLVNGVPQAIDAEINRVETSYLQEYTPVSQYSPAPNWFKVLAPPDTLSQTFAGYMEEYYTRVANDKPKRFVAYMPTSDAIRAYTTETSAQITALETNIITGTVSVAEGLRQLTTLKNAAGWAAVNAEKDAWYQKNKYLFTAYN